MGAKSSIEWTAATEQRVAEIICEHTTIGYELRLDGLVDPSTIRIFSGAAAAHVIVHELAHGKSRSEHAGASV